MLWGEFGMSLAERALPGTGGEVAGLRASLDRWSARDVLPGVAMAVGVGDRVVFEHWTGDACRYGGARRALGRDTLFDAASLTKVMVTLPLVLTLHARGVVHLDSPVRQRLPELGADKAAVTVRHLLTHTSGLPAHREFWRRCGTYAEVLAAVVAEPLVHEPGERFGYSDLGFILLGEMVRRSTGRSLAEAADGLFARLGMDRSGFLPGPEPDVAATEVVDGVALQGSVHDENAAAMGGVAGHAGLFVTLSDTARYAAQWSQHAPLLLPHPLAAEAMALHTHDGQGGRRALAWVAAGDAQWDHVGTAWPASSRSHTGFTGTSIAVDPVSRAWTVVLSNAVHAGRPRPRLREAREDLHTRAWALLQRHRDDTVVRTTPGT
ncbi:serine hydrolase domain-containing protein [Streptomyces sp. NPDC005263]|uniref:serine hydrolase domain-containing protein n=1 Tax=Streptomyces sp. NPDC005263 TaxID=3364711 RepID=UPI0036AE688C